MIIEINLVEVIVLIFYKLSLKLRLVWSFK